MKSRNAWSKGLLSLLLMQMFLLTALLAQNPEINVNPANIDFGEVQIREESVESYQLQAANLESHIVIGTNSPFFSVSLEREGNFRRRLMLRPVEGEINETVYVKFAPRHVGQVENQVIHISREIGERTAVGVTGIGTLGDEDAPFALDVRRIDFGEVDIGESDIVSYNVTAADLEEDIILRSTNGQVTMSLTEDGDFSNHLRIDAVEGNLEQTVYVRFAPVRPMEVRGLIHHNLHRSNFRLLLPFTGTGIGEGGEDPHFAIRPRMLNFRHVAVDDSRVLAYRILVEDIEEAVTIGSENQNFTLSLTEDGEFTQRLQVDPENNAVRTAVYVRFAPTEAGAVRANIIHNIPGAERPVNLIAAGIGVPEGADQRIALQPQRIDFGDVEVGGYEIEAYTVSVEEADVPLIVRAGNRQFSVSLEREGEFTHMLRIAPEDGEINSTVYVRFAPRMAAGVRCQIHHRLYNTRIHASLPVTGTGTNGENDQRITLTPDTVDFGRVAIGRYQVENYNVRVQDTEIPVIIRARNPQLSFSLNEDEGFNRHLRVPPVEGEIDRTVYIKFEPNIEEGLRLQVEHRLFHTQEVAYLNVLGAGYDPDGRGESLDVEDDAVAVAETRLVGNYPNPFNPETTISFELEKSGMVDLAVYNTQGKLVKTLVAEYLNQGRHTVTWHGVNQDGDTMPSGVYLYVMKTENSVSTKRMILLK